MVCTNMNPVSGYDFPNFPNFPYKWCCLVALYTRQCLTGKNLQEIQLTKFGENRQHTLTGELQKQPHKDFWWCRDTVTMATHTQWDMEDNADHKASTATTSFK